jgi:bifunctional enzyme CysN/CysC
VKVFTTMTSLPSNPTTRAQLNIVVVGHVDHGKSTLIGRLLYETDSLPDGKLAELEAMARRRNMPIEWSFVMDAFQAERDQAITIDTTRVWFKSPKRDYVIIDAPGHKEFLRNMISGAASAEGAVLVIDAAEGVREQSRRHGYLLHLLGVRQIIVAVNKMDLVDFDAARFNAVSAEIHQYLTSLGLKAQAIIPISGREGDNLAKPTDKMAWFSGPTLLSALDDFHGASSNGHKPLRLAVQDVYKFDARRIIAGRIESGTLKVGDMLVFSPANRMAKVARIETWPQTLPPPNQAYTGSSIGITLEDQIFVERGDVASHPHDAPLLSTSLYASLFWLGERPLSVGMALKLKLLTREAHVTVQSIERVIDTTSLESHEASSIERGAVGEVILRARELLSLDDHSDNPITGRFVLVDGYQVAGGGIISTKGLIDQRQVVKATNITAVGHGLSAGARTVRNGHQGAVLWLTGLSGAGKSTLALAVERQLFAKGYQAYVLDGDNLRKGLNADLGFSPAERMENIRRVGEVAALFADAGFIVITALISPYRDDRARARAAAEDFIPGGFHEIFIDADLDTCENRDPKGLYKRARQGEIQDFTGISAPYEAPFSPELQLNTAQLSVEDCVARVLAYVEETIAYKNDIMI